MALLPQCTPPIHALKMRISILGLQSHGAASNKYTKNSTQLAINKTHSHTHQLRNGRGVAGFTPQTPCTLPHPHIRAHQGCVLERGERQRRPPMPPKTVPTLRVRHTLSHVHTHVVFPPKTHRGTGIQKIPRIRHQGTSNTHRNTGAAPAEAHTYHADLGGSGFGQFVLEKLVW